MPANRGGGGVAVAVAVGVEDLVWSLMKVLCALVRDSGELTPTSRGKKEGIKQRDEWVLPEVVEHLINGHGCRWETLEYYAFIRASWISICLSSHIILEAEIILARKK